MVELRWIVTDGVRKLQYRQQYDATIRAGMWLDERPPNLQWSDWQDVPEVVERDMGCP